MEACPFCRICAERDPGGLLVLRTPAGHETPGVVAFPALRQRFRNRGHCLVVPAAHVTHPDAVGGRLAAALHDGVARVAAAQRRAYDATGTTSFWNHDIPGQTLHHHHVHVVPRYEGDGFVLPSGDTAADVPLDERLGQAAALRTALGAVGRAEGGTG